jgi:hypothetical protein
MNRILIPKVERMQTAGEEEGILKQVVVELIVDELSQLC